MTRKCHAKIPTNKVYYFTEWDVCKTCQRVQHYEKYKSSALRDLTEYQEKMDFIKNIQ